MNNQFKSNTHLTDFGIRTGAIALALCAASLMPGYSKSEVEAATPRMKQTIPAEEVSESTSEYLGETITMRGEIEETNEYPNSFLIDDERFFGGENILVLNATGDVISLPQEDIDVQVTGEVREFQVAEIEREFDWDLDADYYVEYEGQPAIVATSIVLSPKPEEITENPRVYYGEDLSIEGEVSEEMGVNTFTLENDEFGGEDLLVLNAQTGEIVQDGDKVVVTGEVRPFIIADLEREYSLDWDLDMQRQLEAEYENQPVLVAEGIYPAAE